jgi:hypothetical protein
LKNAAGITRDGFVSQSPGLRMARIRSGRYYQGNFTAEGAMDVVVHLLFEDPIPLCILFGLCALVAGIICQRAGSTRAMTVAFVCVALAMGVALLAWLVETDREKVARTVKTMAAAGEAGDAAKFLACVSPSYENGPFKKEDLAKVVEMGFKYVRVSVEPPAIRIHHQTETAMVTQVYRFLPAPGAPATLPPEYRTWTWEGTFAPDPDREWRLRAAVAMQPEHTTPEEAAKLLSRLGR